MTDPSETHVVLFDLGGVSADLIEVLCCAGMTLTVVEPDENDARRVRDMLVRRCPGVAFSLSTGLPDRCDVFVGGALHAARAPDGALVIVLDGPRALGGLAKPQRAVAMDLLDPRFVEVAFGEASDMTRARALAFLRKANTGFAISACTDSFVGAVLLDAVLALADHLLLVGTTPWDLDEALEQAGFTEGVLKAQDHIGLDVAYARRRANGTGLLVADRMVGEGRLGRSVGVGWYRYPGGGGAVIDPLMEDMIVEEARFARIAPVAMTDKAAAHAVILGIMNVAARLLAMGVPASDLDQVAAHKLGLPGLMGRAGRIGHQALHRQLVELQKVDAELWAPSPDLDQLF